MELQVLGSSQNLIWSSVIIPWCGQKPHTVPLCLWVWSRLWPMGSNPPCFSNLKTSAGAKQEAAISSDSETSKGDCPACWDAVGRGPSTPALTQPSWIQPSVTCHRSPGSRSALVHRSDFSEPDAAGLFFFLIWRFFIFGCLHSGGNCYRGI